MVLLHLLHRLAPAHRWQLTVAHFNHHLRGRASELDEALVRRAAAGLKLPIMVEGGDVRAFARQAKMSLEMAARKLRHEFLARAARDCGIRTVTLAHHADDQVELFFLRLLRGAGGEGLAGMKWRSPSPADPKIHLVRPLLDVTKDDLRGFARAHRIRFREDATNVSTELLRNRIRHELLPWLRKKYQPGLNQTVSRLMDIVGAESELIGEITRRWLASKTKRGNELLGRARHSVRAVKRIETGGGQGTARPTLPDRPGEKMSFNGLPVAVQRRVLQLQLIKLGLAADFEMVEQMRGAPNRPVSVGAGLCVVRDPAGRVKLQTGSTTPFNLNETVLTLTGRAARHRRRGELNEPPIHRKIQKLGTRRARPSEEAGNGPGEVVFDGVRVRWEIEPIKKFGTWRLRTPQWMEFFDADQVGRRIRLRHWQPGDRFQPIGLKSAAKLQDLFTNAKIPRARRRELTVAEAGSGEIFWVEGLRISERFKLSRGTRRRLVWCWQRLPPPAQAMKAFEFNRFRSRA